MFERKEVGVSEWVSPRNCRMRQVYYGDSSLKFIHEMRNTCRGKDGKKEFKYSIIILLGCFLMHWKIPALCVTSSYNFHYIHNQTRIRHDIFWPPQDIDRSLIYLLLQSMVWSKSIFLQLLQMIWKAKKALSSLHPRFKIETGFSSVSQRFV